MVGPSCIESTNSKATIVVVPGISILVGHLDMLLNDRIILVKSLLQSLLCKVFRKVLNHYCKV